MTTADDEVLRLAQSRLGQVLKGKYTLDRVLGVGGMGAVYAATHRNRKRFAIKVLHPELSCVESIRTRFLREGYVANSVNHPGAVAVLDDDVSEDGSAFLVMELLDGASFEAVWEASGRTLPLATLLAWHDQVLEVLAAAHEQGIVHRDLKPANLFLTRTGTVKVLDFGIARLRDATSGGVTQTGAALGTPAFMAPEQALGQTAQVDARTDLWALGATIFVLITGRLVHEGESPSQLLINSATRAAPPLSSIAPGVPQAIAKVVDRALAFSREQRFASALEMKEALLLAHREAFGSELPSTRFTPPELARTELGKVELPSVPPPAVYYAETQAPSRNETNGSPVVHVASVASVPAKRRSQLLPLLAAAFLLALILAGVVGGTLHYANQSRVDPSSGSPSREPAPSAASGPFSSAASSARPQSTAEMVILPVPAAPVSAQRTVSVPGPARAPAPAPAPAPASAPPGLCARLLERQSLGEALSASDQAIFLRTCRR